MWQYTIDDEPVITLIDTPGFNDSDRADTEILKSIVDYLHVNKLQVIAVIYVHRITERKLTGSTKINLRMLRAICGDHFIQNIVFVTSMWTTLPPEELSDAYQREREFTKNPAFWGELLDKGARYFRWDETKQIRDSKRADDIVDFCEVKNGAPPLNILWEFKKGMSLEDTTAGRILTEELRKRQEKERQALIEEREELRALQEEKDELDAMAGRARNEVRRGREFIDHVDTWSSGPTYATRREQVEYLPPPTLRRYSDGEVWNSDRRGDVGTTYKEQDWPDMEYYRERQRRRQSRRVFQKMAGGLALVRKRI